MVDKKINKSINHEHINKIVKKIKDGNYDDFNELINEFKHINSFICLKYFAKGMEKKDLIQEGHIALWKAALSYKDDTKMSFENFAKMVIRRKILNYITVSGANKHIPLNKNISLYCNYFNDKDSMQGIELINDKGACNPEDIYIQKEDFNLFKQYYIKNLTLLEKEVLKEYLKGKSYKEIAENIKKTTKSVDNTIQRAKKKIKREFDNKKIC